MLTLNDSFKHYVYDKEKRQIIILIKNIQVKSDNKKKFLAWKVKRFHKIKIIKEDHCEF